MNPIEMLFKLAFKLVSKTLIFGGQKLGEGVGALVVASGDKARDKENEREYAAQQNKDDA